MNIEYTCWILSGIIAVVLFYLICSEMSKKPATPVARASMARKASSRYANAAPNSQAAKANPQNAASNSEFMPIRPKEPDCATPSNQSDTSHFYFDTGADAESYKRTDMAKAMKSSNTRALELARGDTGNPLAPPARVRGTTTVSWLSLTDGCDAGRKPRPHSTQEIAFGGSSHRDQLLAQQPQ